MEQGLATAEDAPAINTPTSIATNNRYQGFADNGSISASKEEEYDSEGTVTTVESLPRALVTYPRYVPASSGQVRTPFEEEYEEEYGRFITEEEMSEPKYQTGCLEAMVEKQLRTKNQPVGPYIKASQRNVIQVQAAMSIVLAAITATYFRGGKKNTRNEPENPFPL